jgi:hypothetical protein
VIRRQDLPDRSDSWPSLRRKKAVTERVVRDNFFEGFMDELSGAFASSLSYVSDGGLYEYNGVRKLAYQAGREFGEKVLAHRSSDKRIKTMVDYKIPPEVYANAYAEMRLS